jgi:hypothetical protein
MDEQPREAIDEIAPSDRIALEAALQEVTVYVCESQVAPVLQVTSTPDVRVSIYCTLQSIQIARRLFRSS